MSASQALQLMYLHQKAARLTADPWPIKPRRGEPDIVYHARLVAIAEEQDRLRREEFEVAEAARHARGEPAWGPAEEDVRRKLGLPDLAQVTGWSRADPEKGGHDPDTALFGGWRIEDLEQAREEAGWIPKCRAQVSALRSKREPARRERENPAGGARSLKRANPSDVTGFTPVTTLLAGPAIPPEA
jgi:hypothetical protein